MLTVCSLPMDGSNTEEDLRIAGLMMYNPIYEIELNIFRKLNLRLRYQGNFSKQMASRPKLGVFATMIFPSLKGVFFLAVDAKCSLVLEYWVCR